MAILTLEGLDEQDERLDMFLYQSENNIIKLNKNFLILDYDKKYSNMEAFFYNEEEDLPLEANFKKEKKLIFKNDNKTFSPVRKSSPKKNRKKKFDLNLKNFFENLKKNAKEVFLELIQDKMKQKPVPVINQRHDSVKVERNKQTVRKDSVTRFNKEYRKPIQSRTIKIFHQNFDMNDVNYREKEEVINLERQKIIFVAKIFSSIVDLQREIKNEPKKAYEEKVLISYDCLLIDDRHLLTIIIDILILYILGVFQKEISRRLLRKVLHKVYKNDNTDFSFNLKKLFNSESCYILGIYYILCDHLLNLVNKSESPNFDDYKMDKLIPKLNILQNLREKSCEINKNKIDSIFCLRKIEVTNTLIKFYEETKIFDSVMKITQHLNDYIIINQLENELVLDTTAQYKSFLELRNIFFSHLNKKSGSNPIFGNLSDKMHNQFKSENLTNVVFFLHQDAVKQKKSVEKIKKIELSKLKQKLKLLEIKNEDTKIAKSLGIKHEENIFISQMSSVSEISKRNGKHRRKNSNFSLPDIEQSKANFKNINSLNNNLNDFKLQKIENIINNSSKNNTSNTSSNREFLKMMKNMRKRESHFLSDIRLEQDKFKNLVQSKETNTIDHSLKNIKNNFFNIRYDSDNSAEFSKNFTKRRSPKNGIFKQSFIRSLKKLDNSKEKNVI